MITGGGSLHNQKSTRFPSLFHAEESSKKFPKLPFFMEKPSSEQGSREHLIHPEFPPSRFPFLSVVLWFDQSNNRGTALLSWSVFFLLVVGVPIISHFVLVCSDCDFHHRRPYDAVVQLSLSIFAGISFVSLSYWSRKFGMRRFLFLDKLLDVSDKVRIEYEAEIQVKLIFVSRNCLKSLISLLN